MSMPEELIGAVRERVELGYSEEQIKQELVAAGYSESEAAHVWQTVVGNTTTPSPAPEAPQESATAPQPTTPATHANPAPTEDAEPQVAAAQPAAPAATDSTTSPAAHSSGLFWGMVAAFVMVVIAAIAALFYFTNIDRVLGQMSFFSSGAPYDEVTLLPGILQENAETFTADTEFSVRIEPRDEGRAGHEELDDTFAGLTMLAAFSGIPIPDDAYVEVTSEMDIDVRDELPRVDGSGQIEIDFDVFNMRMAGSFRAIDLVAYGRIDEVPAIVRQDLDPIPYQTWIQITDGTGLELSRLPEEAQPTVAVLTEIVASPLRTLLKDEVQTAFHDALAANTYTLPAAMRQGALGSAIDSFDWLPPELQPDPEMEEELRAVIEKAAELWQEYPLIAFPEEPQKTTAAGQTVYQYTIAIDADNVHTFVTEMAAFLNTFPGQTINTDEILAELPTKADINLFNELVDTKLQVRPDGTLQQVSVESILAPAAEDFLSQIRIFFRSTYDNEGEDFTIVVPEDVHEKTLNELRLEQVQQQFPSGPSGPFGPSGAAPEFGEPRDSSVMRSINTARSAAEVYYNGNNFSYAGVCANRIEPLLQATDATIQCNDTVESFVVLTPLPSGDFNCVASDGMNVTFASSDQATAWSECQSFPGQTGGGLQSGNGQSTVPVT